MDDIRYLAFISYARDNNIPCSVPVAGAQCRGWVETLVAELTRCLVSALPRGQRGARRDGLLFIDYSEVRGHEPLAAQIEAKLAASRLFVPVLSQAWFDSDWCLREFETFLRLHPAGARRVFPVWMRPVSADGLSERARRVHAQLREKTGFPFWYKDPRNNHPRTRWDPLPDGADRDYLTQLEDLALGMAEALAAPPPDPATAPPGTGADPAAPAPPTAPSPVAHEVLLNGGTDDADQILALAAHLDRHYPEIGYSIPLRAQPALALGRPPSALNADLRRKLSRCTAVLLIYCDGPPDQIDRQIDLCDRAATCPPTDRPAPTLHLCHSNKYPLSLRPPSFAVYRTADPASCAAKLAAALGLRAAP